MTGVADAVAPRASTALRSERGRARVEHEKRLLSVDLNLSRRHLTDAQKVLVGQRIEPDIAERAKRRQGTRTDLGTSVTGVTEVSRTTDETARTVGLGSGRTYERGKQVLAEAAANDPEVLPRVAAGEVTLADARKQVGAGATARPATVPGLALMEATVRPGKTPPRADRRRATSGGRVDYPLAGT